MICEGSKILIKLLNLSVNNKLPIRVSMKSNFIKNVNLGLPLQQTKATGLCYDMS